jgi:putative transposase
VNAKRIYRLYTEEGLIVRTKRRKDRAQRHRVAQGLAAQPNRRWSMDFVAQRLADGRWIRVLTVVDQFIRECLCLHADASLSGEKVAAALDAVVAERGAPLSITVDNGTKFASRAMDLWADANGVHLDFIRPGRPVENGYIESFNGKLRDECLNVEVFFTVADARGKLAGWREDYNQHRPHSALDDRTPSEFVASWAIHALHVPELAPNTKAALYQAVCLKHSLELQYVQIRPSIRDEPNHTHRNFHPFRLSFPGRVNYERTPVLFGRDFWEQVMSTHRERR